MGHPGLEEIKVYVERLEKDADLIRYLIKEIFKELESADEIDEEDFISVKTDLERAFSDIGKVYNSLVNILIVLKDRWLGDSHEHLKEELEVNNGAVEDHVKVFSDGSCLGNPGPGGWASLIIDEHGSERIISGGEMRTTNNRMELTSVIEALKGIDREKKVVVYTDSRYIRDAFEDNHIERWIANGWKTSSKKDVSNRELWEALYEIVKSFRDIKFVWIEGHSRGGFLSENNNRADLEARKEAKKMKDRLLKGEVF